MYIRILPALILLSCMLAASHANAAVAIDSCEQRTLTPDERAEKSDIVFEGKVANATCECMPLASGEDSFGANAECTDIIEVVQSIKGEIGTQFILKNIVMINADPNVNMSRSTCQSKVDDRNSALIGKSATYFLKQDGDYFATVPPTECR